MSLLHHWGEDDEEDGLAMIITSDTKESFEQEEKDKDINLFSHWKDGGEEE
jgi:hypothetical protein